MVNEKWMVDSILELQQGGGSGGTTNYNALSNKPKINGTELIGNVSFSEMGGYSKAETDAVVNTKVKKTTDSEDFAIGVKDGEVFLEV